MSREMLFYRADDGLIATARLGTDGIFAELADGKLAPNWTHIVPVGRELLFYRAGDGVISTGRLDTEGIFAELAEGGLNPDWTSITVLTA
ncbi:hypothetical protein [Kitasatospora sp. NPDC048538]|uniref:hypothetical protein n=1 Tax=unclassified Kitasatospora TaxID=2633591 RepID=UPI0033D0A1B9